jgi:hypothetical protein
MKRFCILLFAVSVAFAGKGSVYSRYGVGDLNMFMSGKNIGMGNTGTALFGETHINLLNPASTANISRSILATSYQYRNYTSEDGSGSSIIGTGSINSFALAFPVYAPDKMVMTLGLLPYSTVGYEQQTQQTVAGDQVAQTFDGRGGITSAQISLSYAAQTDLVVGLTAQYLFGSIYRDQSITFLTGNTFGGSFNETNSYSGIGFTLGGIYSGFDKAMGWSETKSLNIGATLFTGSSMNLDRQSVRNYFTRQDTVSQEGQTLSLPFGFTFGLAYLKNKVVYAADLQFQNWSGFEVNGIHPAEFSNSLRFGAGVEFLPASDFTGDEFWKRISYRVGGYLTKGNLELLGNPINEMGATAGITFPMSMETRVHLALEYGLRGTTSASLIKDSILRFTVSISATELMFIQPPIE